MKKNTKKTLLFYARHTLQHKFLLGIIILLILVNIGAAMTAPFLFKIFFDTLSLTGLKDAFYYDLITLAIGLFILQLIEISSWRIAGFINNRLQPKVITGIMNECFTYLQGHSYNFFNNNFSGALVKKVNRMSRAYEDVADKLYWDVFPLSIRMIIILGVLLYINMPLGIITLIWTILFLGINYGFTIYKLPYDIKAAEGDTKVTAALSDTITNSVNVKLFAANHYERRRFRKVTDEWLVNIRRASDKGQLIDATQSTLMGILQFVTLYICARLWRENRLTVGDFALIQSYLLSLYSQLWNFGRMIRGLYERLAEAEEMMAIMDTPHEVHDLPNAKKLHIFDGGIEFQNVSFGYQNEKEVISDLSFRVKPSEKVGVIGPSGGGKTTIIKLILRLFNIRKGEILIDHQNIAEVTLDSLHEQIALVPQDPILFHRSIMENIRYGRRDASDEEVVAASRMANCHDFIERLPEGYGTFVGERGVKLSGGERQRVAIARAIVSNAPILILDEATSSLDSESEHLIREALENLMKNKTTLVVAHRLSTIMNMDRVLVLEKGKIIEEGTHGELVGRKQSLYKKLWNLQAGGYLE